MCKQLNQIIYLSQMNTKQLIRNLVMFETFWAFFFEIVLYLKVSSLNAELN